MRMASLDKILALYRRPHHHGRLQAPTHAAEVDSPVCGDRMRIEAAVDGGVVRDVAFSGETCAISTAAASVLLDAVAGKSTAEARRLTPETIEAALGGEVMPGRKGCVAVPVEVLHAALDTAEKGTADA